MTDPKQPRIVPVIAGDLDATSTYAAPGEPYDGVIALAEPNVGAYSAGLTPDQSWFGAQSFNALMQAYGRHLEAIADQPTFAVEVMLRDQGSGVQDYAKASGTPNYNQNFADDQPLIYPAYGGYLLAQVGHLNASPGTGYVRRWHPAAHKLITAASDTISALGSFGDSPFVNGTAAGDTAANGVIGNPTTLGVSRNSAAMISCGDSRTVTLSNDHGVSWAAATALPSDANWLGPSCAVEIGGQWLVADYAPTTTYVNRFLVSADLTAAAWTQLTGSLGGNDGSRIRRICHNDEIAVLLPQTNTLLGYWRPGDSGVTSNRIATIDPTRTGWRGAWNEQIGLFLVGNSQGDLWTSLDGISWSQIANNQAGLRVRDIVAHGRGFVISNSGAEWAIDFLDFDRKYQHRLRRLYSAFAGNSGPASAFHLANLGGRWYGARVTVAVESGPSTQYRLEWVRSGVHAWDANNFVGR